MCWELGSTRGHERSFIFVFVRLCWKVCSFRCTTEIVACCMPGLLAITYAEMEVKMSRVLFCHNASTHTTESLVHLYFPYNIVLKCSMVVIRFPRARW